MAAFPVDTTPLAVPEDCRGTCCDAVETACCFELIPTTLFATLTAVNPAVTCPCIANPSETYQLDYDWTLTPGVWWRYFDADCDGAGRTLEVLLICNLDGTMQFRVNTVAGPPFFTIGNFTVRFAPGVGDIPVTFGCSPFSGTAEAQATDFGCTGVTPFYDIDVTE